MGLDAEGAADRVTGLIPDPTNETIWIIGSAAESQFGAQVGETTLYGVHRPDKCAGRPCVLHNPSDHPMRDWKLNWRGDTRIMERECPHGQGHPDPDDVAFQESIGRHLVADHGCDGCCGPVRFV